MLTRTRRIWLTGALALAATAIAVAPATPSFALGPVSVVGASSSPAFAPS